MQRLGQHFLKNNSAIKKIISSLELRSGETVIEIGPGHGELTFPLAKICGQIGCNLVAIEKDEKLAYQLESIASRENIKNLKIIKGDARRLLSSVAEGIVEDNYKLVGNIPYYITGLLFRLVGNLKKRPVLCVFTIQKEVGERLVAESPHMNRLAAIVQFWGEPRIVAGLPKENFTPKPKVDSAIVKIVTRDELPNDKLQNIYERAVKSLFAQPRKTIINNIYENNNQKSIPKEKVVVELEKIGIDPKSRPQDLSIEDIMKIATTIFS